MVNRYVGAGQKLMDFVIKKIPRKKKVSPTIKSVKPTKLRFKESIKKSKDAEYRKRYQALDKAEDKLKTGKKMMKEGQKERKKLVDTKRAFEFQNIRSFHAVQPGKSKRKDLIKKPTPDKKFKTAKQMEKDERRKREKEPFMGGGMAGRRFGYKGGELVGNQKKIDVAAPFGTINAKDFSKLREKRSMGGGADMTKVASDKTKKKAKKFEKRAKAASKDIKNIGRSFSSIQREKYMR